MIRRPWPIVILALAHILAPFFNLFWGARMLGVPMDFYLDQILQPHRTTELLLHWGLLPLAGIFIFICKKWSYYLFLVVMLAIVALNIYEFQQHPMAYRMPLLLVAMVLNMGIVGYFLVPSVSTVYKDSTMRWWEQASRYDLRKAPAKIFENEKVIACTIENISQTGAKIDPTSGVDPKEPLILEVNYETFNYKVQFEVAHTYQNKLGIRFVHDSESKKQTKALIKSMIAEGEIPRTLVPSWTESFLEWFKGVIKGKGITPAPHDRDGGGGDDGGDAA